MGPFTTGDKTAFAVDHKDDAVRCAWGLRVCVCVCSGVGWGGGVGWGVGAGAGIIHSPHPPPHTPTHPPYPPRGALVLEGGELRWPAPPLQLPAAKPPPKVEEKRGPTDEELRDESMQSALSTGEGWWWCVCLVWGWGGRALAATKGGAS